MKSSIKLMAVAIFAMTAVSCTRGYEREQNQLDKESDGKAMLLKSEYSKKVKVEQSKADLEAAKLDMETRLIISQTEIKKAENELKARVIRAEARAREIETISAAMGGKPQYLEYLKLSVMYEGKGNKTFIATEANMPIFQK